MKIITLLISAGLVFSAAAQSTSSDTKSDDAKKPDTGKVTKVPDSPTIPKDAAPLPDGSFRYVDKDGKKWIYRNTPFGVSKAEERPVAPVVQSPADDPAKSEDLGDSVRFNRPTPFGPKIWTRKKTEMDSYEKSIWDRDRQKAASKQDGTSSKSDAKSRDTAKQD
jgi:hypothetical protein